MASVKQGFTVSGPGIDKKYVDAGPALSRAVTAACRAGVAASFYVRDTGGKAVARTERDESGNVQVWNLKSAKGAA